MKTDQQHFDENGIWEGWMQFDGMTCNEAFDLGYDAGETGEPIPSRIKHAALVAAWNSGKHQYAEEN